MNRFFRADGPPRLFVFRLDATSGPPAEAAPEQAPAADTYGSSADDGAGEWGARPVWAARVARPGATGRWVWLGMQEWYGERARDRQIERAQCREAT